MILLSECKNTQNATQSFGNKCAALQIIIYTYRYRHSTHIHTHIDIHTLNVSDTLIFICSLPSKCNKANHLFGRFIRLQPFNHTTYMPMTGQNTLNRRSTNDYYVFFRSFFSKCVSVRHKFENVNDASPDVMV